MFKRLLCVGLGASVLAIGVVAVPATPSAADAPAGPATKSVVRDAMLATEGQPMLGDSHLPTEQTIEWFDLEWDESAKFGGTDRVCVGVDGIWEECGRFGAEITASVDGEMGMALELDWFGGGSVDVDYPVTVEFTAPADNSFDPGDTVEITTAMHVDADNARITGQLPDLSSMAWTGRFHAGAEADARLCFVDCDNRNLFDVGGGAGGDIVRLNGEDLHAGCFDTILGIATMIALGMDQYDSGHCDSAPYLRNPSVPLTSEVHADGTVTASGSDLYAVVPVSGVTWAFRGLGAPLWAVPNLNTVSYRGVSIGWTTFNAVVTALETMRQDIAFDPEVELTLAWGDEIDFEVVASATGEVLQQGSGTAVTFTAGDTLRLTTPAVGSKVIPITPTVSMATATMSNHTRSVTSGDVELRALSFTLETDRRRVCVEDTCLTLWPGTKSDAGPVYRQSFSLGTAGPSTLFHGSFTLGGFDSVELEGFDLVPRPVVEIRKALVPDLAPGSFDLLIDGLVHATGVRDGGTTGRVVVEPGTRVIAEAEGRDADLRYFDITITCRHHDGGAVHTAAAGSQPGLGSSMALVLNGGEDLVCTVQNRLPMPPECDSMTFDNVILGTPGAEVADLLIGTTGRDVIVGYGGDDTLIGGPGDDCLAGNGGDNIISGGQGNDVIDGGAGNSVCTGAVVVRSCTVTGPKRG